MRVRVGVGLRFWVRVRVAAKLRAVVLRVPSPKGLSSVGEVCGFSKAATHCVRCRCARIRSRAAVSPPRVGLGVGVRGLGLRLG